MVTASSPVMPGQGLNASTRLRHFLEPDRAACGLFAQTDCAPVLRQASEGVTAITFLRLFGQSRPATVVAHEDRGHKQQSRHGVLALAALPCPPNVPCSWT